MSPLEIAALGLRALYELAHYDDQFGDLVELAEASLAGDQS